MKVLTVVLAPFLLAACFSLTIKSPKPPKPNPCEVKNTAPGKMSDEQIIEAFKKIYYKKNPYRTRFLGITSLQYPTDNWVMQEIISEIKPDFIIETGTHSGGTALFYAMILEQVNPKGKVLTVDIMPHHPQVSRFRVWTERVTFFKGSSTDAGIVKKIAGRVKGHKVLVTLDSLHTKAHVQKELEIYSKMVSVGSYIIAQDTHLGGHPNHHPTAPDEGPWGAVHEFLKANKNFVADRSRERHLISQNPMGYLKRTR
jgi:cephalosporin hydroxylase